MSTIAETIPPQPHHRPHQGWFNKSEAWLDDKGKGAWIAAMVLGFVFFWPLGLALLMYMIWSKRMFSKSCGHGGGRSARWSHSHGPQHGAHRGHHMARRHGFRSTGNTAFDAYKAETLQRLLDEQEQFEAFLDRLRQAKDKSEFDQFMTERAEAARNGQAEDAADIDGDDDTGSDAIVTPEPK